MMDPTVEKIRAYMLKQEGARNQECKRKIEEAKTFGALLDIAYYDWDLRDDMSMLVDVIEEPIFKP